MDAATVLVVDDNTAKRYLLRSWLRRAGYTVREAASGGEALERLADGPADAVVLDVQLPDMSGYEVCERIKSSAQWGALPVLHVSANAIDLDARTQGLARGADAYLAEPIEPAELIATVAAMLRYYRARRHAERLATRLGQLVEATLAVNAATTIEGLLSAAARGAASIFRGAGTAAVQTRDGTRLLAEATDPGVDPMLRLWRYESVRPELVDAADGAVVRMDLSTEAGALTPWLGRFGHIWTTVARPQEQRPAYVSVGVDEFTDDDEHLLVQLGQAVAQAVEAVRSYDEERRIALTLQRSLLPRDIPTVPGYDIAVRYEPASEHALVGGDFYELARLDHELVVAIGDVSGHSLRAATVMAELRHALRAYVAEGHPPHEVLGRLNDLVLRWVPDDIASVCLVLLDPATGTLRAAAAGHMPPVLVRDGHPELVDLGGTVLGMPAPRPTTQTLVLPPGGTLILYTDGLVERRGEEIDVGLAQLVGLAGTIEPALDDFCDRLLATLAGPAHHDDVAVVAVRRH